MFQLLISRVNDLVDWNMYCIRVTELTSQFSQKKMKVAEKATEDSLLYTDKI